MAEGRNILSIDVEELFHAEYVANAKKRQMGGRTIHNIPLVLDLLKAHDVVATFFLVGEVAENNLDAVDLIAAEGHEIAFHSYDHVPLRAKRPRQLEAEIARFNDVITPVTGDRCLGFRAPSFSLDKKSVWALDVLEKTGMVYDSSIFPAWTPLYGVPNAPRTPYRPSKKDLALEDDEGAVWEFPVAVYSLFGLRIPAGGGFFLRAMPSLVKRAVKQINRRGSPAVVYVHSWELDPATPKLWLGRYQTFVTYHNIQETQDRLRTLCSDFQFTSFKDYIEQNHLVG